MSRAPRIGAAPLLEAGDAAGLLSGPLTRRARERGPSSAGRPTWPLLFARPACFPPSSSPLEMGRWAFGGGELSALSRLSAQSGRPTGTADAAFGDNARVPGARLMGIAGRSRSATGSPNGGGRRAWGSPARRRRRLGLKRRGWWNGQLFVRRCARLAPGRARALVLGSAAEDRWYAVDSGSLAAGFGTSGSVGSRSPEGTASISTPPH